MKNISGFEKYKNLTNSEKTIRSLENYYNNPNYCQDCGNVIEVKEGQRVNDVRTKKFCDRTCAARFNNKKYPKRQRVVTVCPQCNGRKSGQAKVCHNCKIMNSLKECLLNKMSVYISKGNARIKYNQIRDWARRRLRYVGRIKKCIVCGYEEFPEVLEVVHIKDISDFSPDALMGEVNGLDNLEYMCPTHHKEFDKGFLDITEFRTKQ